MQPRVVPKGLWNTQPPELAHCAPKTRPKTVSLGIQRTQRGAETQAEARKGQLPPERTRKTAESYLFADTERPRPRAGSGWSIVQDLCPQRPLLRAQHASAPSTP
ncbi:hypothetical protein KL916_000177 [Ogataea parapolymorpha]|nr:hypothetical protein KL916_000177 [Ogataea parapolymorpha]